MHTLLALLCLGLAAVTAVPANTNRIVGGYETTIHNYPSIASMLYSWDWIEYWQNCGGTIINSRSILTAAHCVYGDAPSRLRFRVGSTHANSGGVIHRVSQSIISPSFDQNTLDNDIAIMRLATTMGFGYTVQPAPIPGPNYNLENHQVVWAVGWGDVIYGGGMSEHLRHVQVWTISLEECNARYALIGRSLGENMICAGEPEVGHRGQCNGDSGGPLYHNGVLVAVYSWGQSCADPRFPAVNTLVSRHSLWIQRNS